MSVGGKNLTSAIDNAFSLVNLALIPLRPVAERTCVTFLLWEPCLVSP